MPVHESATGATSTSATDPVCGMSIDATTARSLQRVASLQLGFTTAVPEPQSIALLLAGLAVVGWRFRTGRRQG